MKNKIAAVILSILLLAAGSALITPQSVQAADNVKVVMNGQLLPLDGSTAYRNGSGVMIPLRETAEALKYKTSYQGSTGQIQLTRFNETIEFKLSGQELTLNGKDKIPFKEPVEVRQKRIYVPLSFFNAIGLITSYNLAEGQAEIYAPEVMAGAVSGLLAAGKYQELQNRYFSGLAAEQLSLPLIQKSWEGIAVPAGNFFGVKATESQWGEENMTIQSVLYFAKSEAALTLTIDKTGKITGLKLEPVIADEALSSQAN
ncbi:stalk domain-containing protein [Paenibacillus sp. BAC0078]